MNELQIFENSEFGSIRTTEIDGKTYFVGKDVANALGYSNPRDAISRHCKGVVKHDSFKEGGQEVALIPEGDIYRLVIKSQLPNAERFESWIFDEVIPSIRKTGGYAIDVPQIELSAETQLILQLAQSIAKKEIADKERDKRLDSLEESHQNIKEAVKPITDNWREEINSKFNRIQRGSDKPFNVLRTEMYCELERRAGCDLGTRLRNKQSRMRDNGRTKTEINNLNKMDIIEEDKRLKEIFSKIVSEYEIRYCA